MGGWALVIPVKRLSVAKSRLAGYAGPRRAELALAFAADTLAAAAACDTVRGVVVVTDEDSVTELARSMGCLAAPDLPGAGLNAALAHGAAVAARQWPDTGVAALSGDLPALRPRELRLALQAAHEGALHRSAFVADTSGDGTTMLAATSAGAFEPQFGPGSAAAHRLSGGVELSQLNIPSLRRDVDTESDLGEAITLGVGPNTRRVLEAMSGERAEPSPVR